MLKISLRIGAIIALIISFVTLVPFAYSLAGEFDGAAFSGPSKALEIAGYLTMVLATALCFFAIREYREKRSQAAFTFLDGLKAGLATVFIASVLFGVATAIGYAAVGPEKVDAFMRFYVESGLPEGAGNEERAAALAAYAEQKSLWLNPAFQGLIMALTVMLIGTVTATVSAFLLRNPAARTRDTR